MMIENVWRYHGKNCLESDQDEDIRLKVLNNAKQYRK